MNLRYEMYEFITENTISYIHISKHYGRNEIVCFCYEFDYSRNKKIHYRRCEFMPSERSDFGMDRLCQYFCKGSDNPKNCGSPEDLALVPHNLSLFTTSRKMRVMISRVRRNSRNQATNAPYTCTSTRQLLRV